MIIFNIIVWMLVSVVWAWSAWWKSSIEGTKIWPDVMASLGALTVVIVCIVKWWTS